MAEEEGEDETQTVGTLEDVDEEEEAVRPVVIIIIITSLLLQYNRHNDTPLLLQ